MAGADRARRQHAGKNVEEIGAVHAVHAVPAAGIGGQHLADERAVHAVIFRAGPDLRADFGEGVAEPHPLERPQRVRIGEDAGADFTERGRLLVHGDVDAAPDQRIRSALAAESCR
jgi:hypothetical protein